MFRKSWLGGMQRTLGRHPSLEITEDPAWTTNAMSTPFPGGRGQPPDSQTRMVQGTVTRK